MTAKTDKVRLGPRCAEGSIGGQGTRYGVFACGMYHVFFQYGSLCRVDYGRNVDHLELEGRLSCYRGSESFMTQVTAVHFRGNGHAITLKIDSPIHYIQQVCETRPTRSRDVVTPFGIGILFIVEQPSFKLDLSTVNIYFLYIS